MSDESDKREDRREAYGNAKGWQEVASLIADNAVDAFKAGDDKHASLLRALAKDVRDRAETRMQMWRDSR